MREIARKQRGAPQCLVKSSPVALDIKLELGNGGFPVIGEPLLYRPRRRCHPLINGRGQYRQRKQYDKQTSDLQRLGCRH
jgi:hypothetical protein